MNNFFILLTVFVIGLPVCALFAAWDDLRRNTFRLFGVKYVAAENRVTNIIRAIKTTKAGERYFVYFGDHLVFFDRPDCGWKITELDNPLPSAKKLTVYHH